MKLRIPQRPPRNPLVAPALQRKAGRHEKTGKAQRRQDKVQLRAQARSLGRSALRGTPFWPLCMPARAQRPTRCNAAWKVLEKGAELADKPVKRP